jgi:hypothetical protein
MDRPEAVDRSVLAIRFRRQLAAAPQTACSRLPLRAAALTKNIGSSKYSVRSLLIARTPHLE